MKILSLLFCLLFIVGCGKPGNECYTAKECLDKADRTNTLPQARYYTQRAIAYAILEKD